MLRDLYPLLAALTVAAVVYVLRELHKRRTQVNPRLPDLAMPEAWEMWQRQHQEAIPVQIQAALDRELRATETLSLASPSPRHALRLAILESASTSLHLEAIAGLGEAERQALLSGYVAGMDSALRDTITLTTLKWKVLRYYGGLRYDDASEEDWFQYFIEVAQPYIRERVRLAREFVCEMNEGAGRFVARYDALLEELGEAMSKAPPKKRFVRPDLPS